MKKNRHLKKIIDSEKEDLKTLGKIVKGEQVSLRFDIKSINPLKLLADNWLMTIVLLCFLAGGFLLGTISFQSVCNDALLEVQDDCNEFYRGENIDWMSNLLVNSTYNYSATTPINIED